MKLEHIAGGLTIVLLILEMTGILSIGYAWVFSPILATVFIWFFVGLFLSIATLIKRK